MPILNRLHQAIKALPIQFKGRFTSIHHSQKRLIQFQILSSHYSANIRAT